jgi:hypothetical protein
VGQSQLGDRVVERRRTHRRVLAHRTPRASRRAPARRARLGNVVEACRRLAEPAPGSRLARRHTPANPRSRPGRPLALRRGPAWRRRSARVCPMSSRTRSTRWSRRPRGARTTSRSTHAARRPWARAVSFRSPRGSRRPTGRPIWSIGCCRTCPSGSTSSRCRASCAGLPRSSRCAHRALARIFAGATFALYRAWAKRAGLDGTECGSVVCVQCFGSLNLHVHFHVWVAGIIVESANSAFSGPYEDAQCTVVRSWKYEGKTSLAFACRRSSGEALEEGVSPRPLPPRFGARVRRGALGVWLLDRTSVRGD